MSGNLRASSKSAKSGQEFSEGKWLGEVVVHTGIKRFYNVRHRVTRCEHQNRRPIPAPAQRSRNLDATHAGKHPIEHDYVKLVIGGDLYSCATIVCDTDDVVFLLQPFLQQAGHRSVIFY